MNVVNLSPELRLFRIRKLAQAAYMLAREAGDPEAIRHTWRALKAARKAEKEAEAAR